MPYLLDQRGVCMPQIDQIDVVGDRTLLNIRRKDGKKRGRKLVLREDADIYVAVLARVAPGGGAEQPNFRGAIAQRIKDDAA
jgi:hypothetical protein